MRVFLYEYLTGGGGWTDSSQPPSGSLLQEGLAMVRALATDLARCPDTEVWLLQDTRLPPLDLSDCQVTEIASAAAEREAIERLGAAADGTILIAPEFRRHLINRCLWAWHAGAKLLSPDPAFVALASDKHRTARHLAGHQIAVPEGRLLEPGDALPGDFPYPAVLKPNDGAGSVGVQIVESSDASFECPFPDWLLRLERLCQGTAASVTVLSGPRSVLLPPCGQRICRDHYPQWEYVGGSYPLEAGLSERARKVAQRVVGTLPAVTGYFGIDMVLGQCPLGSEDVVIEINPRLTTSYVGLRQRTAQNLAQAMLEVAAGKPVQLEFDQRPLVF